MQQQPFFVPFNVACQHIASKLWPLGFDVSGVDTNKPAPSTLAELNRCIAEHGRLIVDGSNSDNTIFACAETNYAFRAWHDWCHWRFQLPFTLDGEARVARRQIEHVRTLYGTSRDANLFAALIDEEVIGQAAYKAATDKFPTDQRAFAATLLAPCFRHYGLSLPA